MHETTAIETISYGTGTEIEYKVFGKCARQALTAGKAEVIRLEHKLSRFNPKSEISKVNKYAGAKAVKVSQETYEVMAKAMKFFMVSEGLFDVTVAPLVELWDYKHSSEAPKESPTGLHYSQSEGTVSSYSRCQLNRNIKEHQLALSSYNGSFIRYIKGGMYNNG